jgi:hypothetical protein
VRNECLYCGSTLVPYQHWGICPKCEPGFLASITPPSIADQVKAKVGGLLREKGRPTIGGETR